MVLCVRFCGNSKKEVSLSWLSSQKKTLTLAFSQLGKTTSLSFHVINYHDPVNKWEKTPLRIIFCLQFIFWNLPEELGRTSRIPVQHLSGSKRKKNLVDVMTPLSWMKTKSNGHVKRKQKKVGLRWRDVRVVWAPETDWRSKTFAEANVAIVRRVQRK